LLSSRHTTVRLALRENGSISLCSSASYGKLAAAEPTFRINPLQQA